MTIPPQPRRATLKRLAAVGAQFLKIGFTAFGGPAAHIAMMRREVVEKRRWITDQHFLDLLGAANLFPGPTSSKVAMYVGLTHAGLPGLFAGGLGFLLPAMLMVLGLAWAYIRFSMTPAASWLLYGVKPVIIPIIILALWELGQEAVKGWLTAITGVVVLVLYFLEANLLLVLLGSGIAIMLIRNARRLKTMPVIVPVAGIKHALSLLAVSVSFSLGLMFLTFLKVGVVMYGSGYTLFAFLQSDFIARLGWLSDQQLIDAIAIGQMTPGPLSTTATFIGYVLGGVPGALLGTLGIYIPSFIFVAISNPIVPRLRDSPWASGFLDGVNVAAVGLMAAVTLQLARAAFTDAATGVIDPLTVVIGLAAAIALFRFKVDSAWLVLGGAVLGLLSAVVR